MVRFHLWHGEDSISKSYEAFTDCKKKLGSGQLPDFHSAILNDPSCLK
jgi:hypothetical protein